MQETSTAPITSTQSRKPGTDAMFLFLLTVCVVVAAYFLFFTNNRFSFKCHADEPGKVEQIQTQERNYHHPMLMLNTAQAAFALSGIAPDPQKIVWLGRVTIAVFSTLTVLAFAYTGFLAGGRVGAILCAVFLLGSPLLIELSHYFKEDPSMMMGIAIAFLAIALYQRKPSFGNVLLLAAGAALACSGKHVGAVILPFCVYNILKEGGPLSKRHLLLFVGVALGLYGLINYQVIVNFCGFMGGLDREVILIAQGGSTPSVHPTSVFVPLGKYFGVVRGNVPFPLFWFFGFGIYALIKLRPQKTPLGQVLIFAAIVFLMLAGVPKTAARYALPVICALYLAAAIGAAWIFAKPGWVWKTVGFALPLIAALGIEAYRSQGIYNSFKDDNRVKMARWIAANLPQDALIAQEPNGLLACASENPEDSPYPIPQKVCEIDTTIQERSLDSLLSSGVQYMALLIDEHKASKNEKAAMLSREVAAKCEKVWECTERGPHVGNLKPDLAIFKLQAAR